MARILVFTKAPVAGQVKTRLTPRLTPEQAARVHLALLERTVGVTAGASLARVELWVADDPENERIRRLAARHDLAVKRQSGADLGDRMYHAAAATLGQGRLPIIIGTDCPEMNAEYLREACRGLTGGVDVVLGPAEDGGYVLIGLSTDEPRLFQGVSWSTSAVMDETRERIRECALSSMELDTLWDLDRPADLARLDLSRLLDEYASP